MNKSGRQSSGNRVAGIFITVLLYCQFLQLSPANANLSEYRDTFKLAEQALASGDQTAFVAFTQQLKDYPVVAYLHFDALEKRLSSVDNDEVKQFLSDYADYPFRYSLLSRWLDILAQRNDWKSYLAFYDDRKEARYQCLALTARLNLGQVDDISDDIEPLWLSGYSQPEECDPAFAYFLEHHEHASKALWQRIEKAFLARRPSLAKFLAKKLDDKDQNLVELWYQAHRNPQDTLQKLVEAEDTMMNRKIIIHAFDRLARRNSLEAKSLWSMLQSSFRFNREQQEQITKRIALSAALQHQPESKQLLEQLPNDLKNDTAHLWLARIHLRDEDWIGLIRSIQSMPDRLKKEAEWVYWLARAYEEAGHEEKAKTLFDELAQRGTYYGFLAADRVGLSYQINQQQAAEHDFDEQLLLNQNLHLLRARELFFLDRRVDARREWFQGIRKLNTDEIKQAASMASRWKWYDSAIKTVAKTSHRNDYDLRFPMPYQDLVMNEVKSHGLDPSVIYGVMRRESLFDPLAKSRVGALGLMQLMPATARRVAQSLGLKKPQQQDILKVENNIRFGTQYFKTVLDQFDDNVVLAAAAYNAGPGNVKKWLPQQQALSADLWVETVPFKETRNYIQAVLAYATIFDKHLEQQVPISSRMEDVRSDY